MAELIFYVQEDAQIRFEKVELRLLGEVFAQPVQKVFSPDEGEAFHAALEEQALRVLSCGITLLEQIGETDDYLAFLYLTYQNPLRSPYLTNALRFPFAGIEAVMLSVLDSVADELAEKFFEELSNRVEEGIDDELIVDFRRNEQLLQLEILAPKALQLEVLLPELVRDYQGILDETFQELYEELS